MIASNSLSLLCCLTADKKPLLHEKGIVGFKINISRTSVFLIYPVFMIIAFWLIGIFFALMVSVMVIWNARKVEPPVLAASISLIFALPAFRNSAPQSPPIGIIVNMWTLHTFHTLTCLWKLWILRFASFIALRVVFNCVADTLCWPAMCMCMCMYVCALSSGCTLDVSSFYWTMIFVIIGVVGLIVRYLMQAPNPPPGGDIQSMVTAKIRAINRKRRGIDDGCCGDDDDDGTSMKDIKWAIQAIESPHPTLISFQCHPVDWWMDVHTWNIHMCVRMCTKRSKL